LLWVSEDNMAIVNERREVKGKPAIGFGIICPDPTDPKSALRRGAAASGAGAAERRARGDGLACNEFKLGVLCCSI
jgi:hypothetical protein